MQATGIELYADNHLKAISAPKVGRKVVFPKGFAFFRIRARMEGREVEIHPADFARAESRAARGLLHELVFSDSRKLEGLRVTIGIWQAALELRFSFAIELPEGAAMVPEIDFPVIPADFAVGDDRLLIPSDKGDLLLDPATELHSWGFPGHARFAYPGRAAMQYSEVYNQTDGLYAASYNFGGESFDIGYEAPPPKKDLRLFNRWYPYIEGGRWFAPTTAVALHPGDWHAGADIYRSVMAPMLRKPQRPEWMYGGFHGWAKMIFKFDGKPVAYTFSDLPKLAEPAIESGVGIIDGGGWSGIGFDTRYPDYGINPEVGTAEDLRKAIDKIHRAGGKVMLYTNGRLVDEESEFWKRGGSREVVVNEDGALASEDYSTSSTFRIACPSSAEYRKRMAREIAHVAGLGVDGIQIDQISMAPCFNCFDNRHDHTRPSNNWTRGTEELLREMRLAHRGVKAETFSWIEGVHELFGQYYDVSQPHGEVSTWVRKNADGKTVAGFPEMFRYTFPDYLVTGVADYEAVAMRTMLEGKPFDVNLVSLQNSPELRKLLRGFVTIRQKYPQFYFRGRYLDATGFAASYGPKRTRMREGIDGPLMARAIESADGRKLLVGLWKKQDAPLKVSLAVDAKYGGGVKFIYPGKRTSRVGRKAGGKLEMELREPFTLLIQ